MDNTQILYLAGAFLLGFIIAWFAGRGGPKRAAEEAVAETESVRRKLKTVESDLSKTQGQQKENLATLDQMAADKENLVKMLKVSEQGLTDASAELSRLSAALDVCNDARLLMATELDQARSALSDSRSKAATLTSDMDAIMGTATEVVEAAEATALVEHVEVDALADRMVELESELALARATADRLAEKQILVLAELTLRRRKYSDIIAGGEDTITEALAARDRAITDAQTELDYMRRDLSMLTAAGAQLASALEQRNSEYAVLLDRVAFEETSRLTAPALPLVAESAKPSETPTLAAAPEWTAELEARTAELDELKSEHENLKATLEEAFTAREVLQQQLEARGAEIDGLNGKMAAADAEFASLAAEKEALVSRLQERAALVGNLLSKIGDYDGQLRSILAAAEQMAPHSVAENSASDNGATQEAETVSSAQGEEGETHVS